MVLIDDFYNILGTIDVLKRLYDIERTDLFNMFSMSDLNYDSYFECMYTIITSLFSGYYSSYDDESETELMIFEDECITKYFQMACEYGQKNRIPHEQNKFVIEIQNEINRNITYCSSIRLKLLDYTKTKKKAKKSKLLIYLTPCTCDNHLTLVYLLIHLYSCFTEKNKEYESTNIQLCDTDTKTGKEAMVA